MDRPFFGPFPALFRGDYKNFVIMILLAAVTAGLSNIVYAFIYNKIYLKELIVNGYKAKESENPNLDAIKATMNIDIPTI